MGEVLYMEFSNEQARGYNLKMRRSRGPSCYETLAKGWILGGELIQSLSERQGLGGCKTRADPHEAKGMLS